ncbi:thiazole synthase [Candidatus Marinamargulisbacteria bacterium]|jgi:thiazole synthase|nr:thiazole synthase [Candidatus Marinamargulisbacteria bacterium]
MTTKLDSLIIADRTFQSRLLLGTGKFSSMASMRSALEGARTELVTVALRRVDLNQPQDDMLTVISPDQYCILPNTSGARNAEEAIRLAQLARATGVSNWIKLEVIPDARYLLPDGHETLKAAEALVKDGFVVLPYIQADPLLAKQLEAVGCATVMPLASPIGSNQGVQTEAMLRIIIEQATVPVVVDAGLGKPSEAARVMELGADAVLVNTAIATAPDPEAYAMAFRLATQAGRLAYTSGMPRVGQIASASSPTTGTLTQFLHD